jgi:hypothetical protein
LILVANEGRGTHGTFCALLKPLPPSNHEAAI